MIEIKSYFKGFKILYSLVCQFEASFTSVKEEHKRKQARGDKMSRRQNVVMKNVFPIMSAKTQQYVDCFLSMVKCV